MSYFDKIKLIDSDLNLFDHTVQVDHFKNLRVAEIVRLIGGDFVGSTKDTNFWTESNVGSGAVTLSNGSITIATGATSNSTTQYQTIAIARFIIGVTNIFRCVIKLGDTGTSNNIRNWGAFDVNNGAFFQLNGNTLNVVTRNGGIDTPVARSNWVHDTSFVLDTNYHVYEIHFSYVHIHFMIDGVCVHEYTISSALPSQTFNLPVTLQNNNSGNSTSNISMVVTVATILRLGKLESQATYKHINGSANTVCKQGGGAIHDLVINTPDGALTMFDNTGASGNIIAIMVMSKNSVPISLAYNIPFFNGLTIQTSGGSTVDVTLSYE